MKKIFSYALTAVLATIGSAAFAQSGTVENLATTARREAGSTAPRQASAAVKSEKAAASSRTDSKTTKRAVTNSNSAAPAPAGRATGSKPATTK